MAGQTQTHLHEAGSLAGWRDRTTPQMPRPAMAPWPEVPAHAAKMKMHSLPYMEELSWSVRPAPYELEMAMNGTRQKATHTKYHCASTRNSIKRPDQGSHRNPV